MTGEKSKKTTVLSIRLANRSEAQIGFCFKMIPMMNLLETWINPNEWAQISLLFLAQINLTFLPEHFI